MNESSGKIGIDEALVKNVLEYKDPLRKVIGDGLGIHDDLIKGIEKEIMRAIQNYQMKYEAYPKYVLLNREAYGAFRLIRRTAVPADSTTDSYAGLTIICDPEQESLARVLPEPEQAFSLLHDTEWEVMRQKYDQKLFELEEKFSVTETEKQGLLSGYSDMQRELKNIRIKGIIMTCVAFILMIVLQLLF
ncbi:hypothetical protein D1872_81190 [compost metagenome]